MIARFSAVVPGDVAGVGGKAANLAELTRAGFAVPPGFVVTTDGYRSFVAANGIGTQIQAFAGLAADSRPEVVGASADQIRALFDTGWVPEDLRRDLLTAYADLGSPAVAVRSSATAEDLADASFAGQQDTFLNVCGEAELLLAVRDCWASLWTARALAYRLRQGIDPATVALAVVVQEMVRADAAGVLFTANPANGRRDQVALSAAWGLGESVVSGSVDTDDLVVAADGTVVSRQTADKVVMTVYADRGTVEEPVPADRRRAAVLSDAEAGELAALGRRIADHFGAPQDIEWVRADGATYVVQSRPITALPEPEDPPPTDWSVPPGYYFRASIVEQLPDPLSPLFADLVDGSVTRSIVRLMADVLGPASVRPGDVSLPTVNGYAYYRYTRSGMARVTLLLPVVAWRLADADRRARMGVRGWRDVAHPQYAATVERWRSRPIEELGAAELLTGIGELLDAGTTYYTAVQSIIPLAATSEVLFTALYDRLVRRSGDPAATSFLLGFDSEPIRAETSLYALAGHAQSHPDLTAVLTGLSSERLVAALRSGEAPDGVDPDAWRSWAARFEDHLQRFGHAVYNLDFVNAVPADEPGPLLDALRFYLRGQGTDPAVRQAGSSARREGQTAAVLARLDPVRGAVFGRALRWAQAVAPVREDALADVGLAWPLLRRLARELGRRLVADGVVDRIDDVFWLREAELHAAATSPAAPTSLADEVEARKRRWRGRRRVTPPQMLPTGGWMRLMERALPAVAEEQEGSVLKGITGSNGRVTAVARVLTGPQDFAQLQPGEVLVASITTPAWTSLFAQAAAVVTDIGGPLSHSSIVAREYGIPAVLGTGTATRRIVTGQRVVVDGDAGTVTLLADGEEEQPVADPQVSARRLRTGRARRRTRR